MERDSLFSALAVYAVNFNSHAHVERDSVAKLVKANKGISTHTLTWSVTDCERDWDENVLNFNSHAHVERDR